MAAGLEIGVGRLSVNLPVRSCPWLESSTAALLHDGELLVLNESALYAGVRGVVWHDDEAHCPTWAGFCRCDVEGC